MARFSEFLEYMMWKWKAIFLNFDPEMRRLFKLIGTVYLAVLSVQQNVDSYVQSETPIAKAGVLANIGPNGSKSSGAAAGVVIASPSTTNPDYLFTWTRDSSLVSALNRISCHDILSVNESLIYAPFLPLHRSSKC